MITQRQNIPKKELGIRRAFTADDGKCFLSLDFSNLEIFVLAYESGDNVLIDALEQGVNVHDLNTKTLFNIDETSPSWGLARRAAKIFMFGGISYGGGDEEIYQKIILEAPQLALTLAQYKEAKARYMAAHPKYTAWAKRVIDHAKAHRVSQTFLGRKRILLGFEKDIEKQALNTPIQGGAAGIINRAMIRVFHQLSEVAPDSRLILQIHDELVFECPYHETPAVYQLAKREMEAPVMFYGTPRTFRADADVGPDWGKKYSYEGEDLKEYEL